MISFGEQIKAARKTHNLTQKQLAEKIGAAHNSISDWENNKNRPDADMIELLCKVLDITPDYLFTSSPNEFSAEERLLIKKFRLLDSYGQGTILMVLDNEIDRVESQKKRIYEYAKRIAQEMNKL